MDQRARAAAAASQGGDTLTSSRIAFRVGSRVFQFAQIIFFWVCIGLTSSDERTNFFYKLLLATTIFHSMEGLYEGLQTTSQCVWFAKNGPGPITASELPGARYLSYLSLPASISKLAKIVALCWITNRVFPLQPCDDNGQIYYDLGCGALHFMGIYFVAFCCFSVIICCFICIAICVQSHSNLIQRHGSDALGLFVSSEMRTQILGRLPISKEPPKDDVCAICLTVGEPGVDWRVLPCSHRFHQECVDEFLKEKGTCPTCRYDITHAPPVTATFPQSQPQQQSSDPAAGPNIHPAVSHSVAVFPQADVAAAPVLDDEPAAVIAVPVAIQPSQHASYSGDSGNL